MDIAAFLGLSTLALTTLAIGLNLRLKAQHAYDENVAKRDDGDTRLGRRFDAQLREIITEANAHGAALDGPAFQRRSEALAETNRVRQAYSTLHRALPRGQRRLGEMIMAAGVVLPVTIGFHFFPEWVPASIAVARPLLLVALYVCTALAITALLNAYRYVARVRDSFHDAYCSLRDDDFDCARRTIETVWDSGVMSGDEGPATA